METPFPEDPMEVLRINDAHRGPDADGTDLWSADQLAALPAQAYRYRVPTMVPELWPKGQRPSQKEYDADFRRRDPLAAAILSKMNLEGAAPRIVVAGGAAAAPYFEENVEAGDADFFAVGLKFKEFPKLAQDFIQVFCDCQQELALSLGNDSGNALGVLTVSEDTLTVAFQARFRCQTYNSQRLVVRKYQLIIQAFSSGSAVVHSFGVPSSCTFYDGQTAWSSTLGAYAHLFRVNLINPEYRTSIFESHLIKYFNQRYYALGFVDLATQALLQTKIELELLTVIPQQVCGNWATGKAIETIKDYDENFTEEQTVSPSLRLRMPTAEVALFVADLVHWYTFLNRTTVVRTFERFERRLTKSCKAAVKTPIDWWVKTYPGDNYLLRCPNDPEWWYRGYALAAKPGKASPNVLEQSLLAAQKHGCQTPPRCPSHAALNANRPCCCEIFDQNFGHRPSASLLLLK